MAKDVDLFKAAMAGVKPLRGRKVPDVAPKPKAEPAARSPKNPVVAPGTAKPGAQPRVTEAPFDGDVDRALSRGRRSPEATLDLHGMTLAAAERAVAQFLTESSHRNRRVV